MTLRGAAAVCAVLAWSGVGRPSPAAAQDATAVGGREVPVLLVPGWSDTERDLAALRIRLVGAGWSERGVLALGFKDPFGGNNAHAGEIARAVDSLRARTGAERVDIVAHSMGGLATRKYLADLGGAERVRRVVLIATPNRGTLAAYVAFGGGRDDMIPGSAFLDSLNAGASVPAGIQALTIRTSGDLHILPGASATLAGVPDVEVCCPSHEGLLRDEETFRVTLRFLRTGAHQEEIR